MGLVLIISPHKNTNPASSSLFHLRASISHSSPPLDMESNPSDAVIFAGLCLALGVACRHVLRRTRVPYTVVLLIIGIGLGSLEYGTHHQLGKIGNGIRLWSKIDPGLLLAVFLPPLLFEGSFSMEFHQIKWCIAQMILLAGPGVLLSTFCLGSVLKLTFPYNWSWKTSLLLGGLLSATDPVAVVALLKELGACKKLTTIIEGESMMNDGVAMVVYTLFYRMVLGESFSWVAVIKFLSEASLGAVGIGLAFGIASVLWLGYIFNDIVMEITLTLAVSYVAYFTAQEGADVSGILTVVTLGMFYSAVARIAFKSDGPGSLHHFWEMVAYISNTLIFILSGVIIAEGILNGSKVAADGKSWAYLFLLYAYVQASRFIVVGALYPFLSYFGHGLDWKEAVFLIWSGLRGPVSLALSLSVKSSGGKSNELNSDTGTQFVFFTGGIVFLTIIVNASTTQLILHLLDMDNFSSAKKWILEYSKYELLNKALETFGELGDDEELGPADWHTVKRYLTCLNSIEGQCIQHHGAPESDSTLDPMKLKDVRICLLNGVQTAYWEMLDERRISQTTADILMRSVEEARDLASLEPLCDWRGLRDRLHFPSYYNFLQTGVLPQKLVTYFVVERLESSCCVCAAFLRAHRIARQQLHGLIGDSNVSSIIINESVVEGEEARKFLDDVHKTFPQVLRLVKTRQAAYLVLNHLIEYVQNLEKSGLLVERMMLHLHEVVQTDLKKLVRTPLLLKFPEKNSIHPMLGSLPSSVHEPLSSNSREMMKLRGLTVYKKGSKADGIWLMSSGVVKSESNIIRNKNSFCPTFTHGSTLGLYEVLTGRPYICDVITDSVVLCFFLEDDKILSCLKSDSSVEYFLWQESAIFLCKILLPQIFEKMAMQNVRALVVERSVMTVHIRGESIEIPHHSVGILLEGYVKMEGLQELITSPAALLPSHGNLSFQNLEASGIEHASFSHQDSSYLVENRARVIVFDIGAFEADAALSRRSSSLLTRTVDYPHRCLSKEHSGLSSLLENFIKPKHHKQYCQGVGQQASSLSARAMQLSIYGCTVDICQPRSFSSNLTGTPYRKDLEVNQCEGNVANPSVQNREQRSYTDDTIAESTGEEDIIVRID
ncbi:sodium/hydrogen exchanger 8-like isoform X1 [Prosopis cineraria]|uniref:sodium/hydrogen exchanger 8-like isoform X1 n=1 Tax=Prosopis cineraria TaxID=364024 RepID=UPI00240FABA0|nr:sodium/hydrogen exchanger 8-like isoform X1 [Prosopis cineraria]